jgi:hypothetical protein
MTIPQLKGKQKTAVNMVKNMMIAEKNGNIKKAQSEYNKLMKWCEKNNINFNNTIKGAKQWIEKYDIAMAMNGYN